MAFGITLKEVSIYRLEEGVFYSKLICKNGGKDITIDARTSDAIALALRFKCSIYTSEEILQKSGIVIDIDKESETLDPKTSITNSEVISDIPEDDYDFSELEIVDLEEILEEAVRYAESCPDPAPETLFDYLYVG